MRVIDWNKVRGAYEAGETVARLAQLQNVKAARIRERAAQEDWGANAGEEALKAEQARKRVAVEKRFAAAGALRGMPEEKRQALVDELLARFLRGDTPGDMARELGATRATLYYVLLGGADEMAHADLITQALTARIAKADDMLENAEGPVEISRAREMARFARFDYERRRPALYGQQKRLEIVPGGYDLGDRLRRARERVVEGVAEPSPAAALAAPLYGERNGGSNT